VEIVIADQQAFFAADGVAKKRVQLVVGECVDRDVEKMIARESCQGREHGASPDWKLIQWCKSERELNLAIVFIFVTAISAVLCF
jgi:hypothetical protein